MPSEASSFGVGHVRRVLMLRKFPGLADLSAEQLGIFAEHMTERTYAAGEDLYLQDTESRGPDFIVYGSVATTRDGRQIRVFGPGAVVGGLSSLIRQPHVNGCVALEKTTVLEISAEDMQEILEDHFVLLRSILSGMARGTLEVRRRLGARAGFVDSPFEDVESPSRPLDLVERMFHLRRSIPFGQGRIDALADLAREAVEVRYDEGVELWREGDAGGFFIEIVSGLIRGTSSDGQEFTFGPGDTAGILDALGACPRWFSARVAKPVFGLRLEADTLFDVLEDHFELALDVLGGMAGGILRLQEELAERS